jgi:hypothetical protein
MSLNRILYNGDTSNGGGDSICVKSLDITGDILHKKKDYNELGNYLTCYAPGRAKFLTLPRIYGYEFALVGIEAATYNNVDNQLLDFNIDTEVIDSDTLVTSRSGNNNTVEINKAGTYLVSYKITRKNNSAQIKSFLRLADANIAGFKGSLQVNTSSVQYESIVVSGVAKLEVGNLIRLAVNVFSVPNTGTLELAPLANQQIPALKTSELSPSYLSFIRIGD